MSIFHEIGLFTVGVLEVPFSEEAKMHEISLKTQNKFYKIDTELLESKFIIIALFL